MLVISVSLSSSLTKVQPLRTVGSLGRAQDNRLTTPIYTMLLENIFSCHHSLFPEDGHITVRRAATSLT